MFNAIMGTSCMVGVRPRMLQNVTQNPCRMRCDGVHRSVWRWLWSVPR